MRPMHAALALIARSGSRSRHVRPRRQSPRRTLLALLAFAVVTTAAADDYPARPIRVIVPFSPGGAVDGPMRVIAQELSKRLGPAGGRREQARRRRDDRQRGRREGCRRTATRCCSRRRRMRSARRCTRSSPYDPIEDFAPISLIGREPGVLVVQPRVAGEDAAGVDRAT